MTGYIFVAVCVLPCLFLTLSRAIHLFQLESYYFAGYRRALKAHAPRFLCAKTIFPLFVILVCGIFAPPACLAGAGLFILINLPPKMKKPLVYTPRVRRLCATSVLLSAALCAGCAFFGRIAFTVCACLAVLFQPWLLILSASVNSPLERAIAAHFVRGAKNILRAHDGLKIIGITGSYGKTSTKFFLQKLLSVRYNVFMTPGNFNTTLGVTRAVREGLRPFHEVFICEMGARHTGDIREICELVHPTVGIITAVGVQHLETFGSQENILRGKLELYDAVRENGGALLINTDSEPLAQALPSLCGNVISCGKSGDYAVSDIEITDRGSAFCVCSPAGVRCRFETQLLGSANVQDLALAIACADMLGVPMASLVPAVRALQSVPHRLQLISRNGISIIDDAYNSNPQGARAALDTLAMCGGCRVLITPGLVELGERESAENRSLGAYAAARCDYAVLVGENRAAELSEGLMGAGFAEEKIYRARDISAAFDFLHGLSAPHKFALLLNDLPDNYK